ncbi:hypothetical protein, partial [Rossellomorea marisflavi]|uniref:hypothetical protein n=1 Tax=Rossellomorea marisflavi TaxID=189381 RepID=UPI00345D09F3
SFQGSNVEHFFRSDPYYVTVFLVCCQHFFEKFLTIIASATITSLPINFAEVNFFLKLSQKFF